MSERKKRKATVSIYVRHVVDEGTFVASYSPESGGVKVEVGQEDYKRVEAFQREHSRFQHWLREKWNSAAPTVPTIGRAKR